MGNAEYMGDPMAFTYLHPDLRKEPHLLLEAARASWTARDVANMAEEDCVGCERLLNMHRHKDANSSPVACASNPQLKVGRPYMATPRFQSLTRADHIYEHVNIN